MSRARTVDEVRDRLAALSRELGREERQLAVLGEGNTSAALGDGSFWVKASGASLGTLGPAGLVRVRSAPLLAMLERPDPGEVAVETALLAARVEPGHRKPSVEAFLHAVLLAEEGVAWVGHTHPVAVNRLLCSRLGAEPFRRHVFPDAVVVCGVAPAVVPWVEPGFALAVAAAAELARYRAEHGRPPRLLLLESHGLVALGSSPREVLNVTLMADKWARVLEGAYALGGPAFLPDGAAERIDARLDEAVRRRALAEEGGP